MELHLGYEIGTGAPVGVPLHHLAITGQTRLSGKTTTVEALLSRLPEGWRALVFRTKRGELAFQGATPHRPYYQERVDWQYVQAVLEAAMRERLKFERSWIIRASKGAKRLRDVYHYIVRTLESGERLRGLDESVWTNLRAYFEKVLPQLERHPFADRLNLAPGLNVMDLGPLSEEVQALVIAACLEELHARGSQTIIVIPEAWKFIPQSRGNPVKWAAEHVVREGGASQLWLWFDAQDITGMDKQPLKSVGVWCLGRQMERNEVRRVLDQVPSASKPKPEDVARLAVGHFYVAAEDWCRLVYVEPAWMDSKTARAIALGQLSVRDVTDPSPKAREDNTDNTAGEEEEDPMVIAKLEKENERLKRGLSDLEKQSEKRTNELKRLGDEAGQAREKLKSVMQWAAIGEAFGKALALLPNQQRVPTATGAAASVGDKELDEIARRVALLIPGKQPVVPLEALRERFLADAKQRVLERAQAIPADQRRAILWLVTKAEPVRSAEWAAAFGVRREDGAPFIEFTKGLGKLKDTRLVSLDNTWYRAAVRDAVKEELAPHSPSDEDVEQVYQHVLSELATG